MNAHVCVTRGMRLNHLQNRRRAPLISGRDVWLGGDNIDGDSCCFKGEKRGKNLQSDLCVVTQQLLTVDKCFVLWLCVFLVRSQVCGCINEGEELLLGLQTAPASAISKPL